MYTYVKPKPIEINLNGEEGYKLRVKATKFVEEIKAKGIEAGSKEEQSYGVLAEMAIRNELGLPDKSTEDPLGYDIKLENDVKIDVKCRSGVLPFQEEYEGSGDISREAKHNLWARQLLGEKPTESDVYLLTHLKRPKIGKGKPSLPGKPRERSWFLYICGWVSTVRAKNEGVYLPRGALTEQGKKWFPYRGEEIEFYHQHLNGLSELKDILKIDKKDIENDTKTKGKLHLTSIDALRIALDSIGRGILTKEQFEKIKEELSIKGEVTPFFHSNQYHHLMKWLIDKKIATEKDLEKLKKIMLKKEYSR